MRNRILAILALTLSITAIGCFDNTEDVGPDGEIFVGDWLDEDYDDRPDGWVNVEYPDYTSGYELYDAVLGPLDGTDAYTILVQSEAYTASSAADFWPRFHYWDQYGNEGWDEVTAYVTDGSSSWETANFDVRWFKISVTNLEGVIIGTLENGRYRLDFSDEYQQRDALTWGNELVFVVTNGDVRETVNGEPEAIIAERERKQRAQSDQ